MSVFSTPGDLSWPHESQDRRRRDREKEEEEDEEDKVSLEKLQELGMSARTTL